MGVMMLAASKGSEVTLYADGEDEEESINKLEELINNRFNEDE
jgi:phosphocarrier protein